MLLGEDPAPKPGSEVGNRASKSGSIGDDRSGSSLRDRAVIEVNPDALTIADERDIERKKGTMRGPLHGIPYLVKDVGYTDRQLSVSPSFLGS